MAFFHPHRGQAGKNSAFLGTPIRRRWPPAQGPTVSSPDLLSRGILYDGVRQALAGARRAASACRGGRGSGDVGLAAHPRREAESRLYLCHGLDCPGYCGDIGGSGDRYDGACSTRGA